MTILAIIARVENLAQQILTALVELGEDNARSARLLELRCELNAAICDLYGFIETHGDTFNTERRKVKFSQSVEEVRSLYACANTVWPERLRLFHDRERRAWAARVEGMLAEYTCEMRRQLNSEQFQLRTGDPDAPQTAMVRGRRCM